MRQKKLEKQKPKTVTVQGVMELIDYGDDLIPFDAVLLTDDDEEFYVEFPNKGSKLNEYANQYVEITGNIFKQDEHTAIAAKRIIIVDQDAENDSMGSDDFQDMFGDYYDSSYDEASDLQDIIKYNRRSSRNGYRDDF